jgi:hypothetical protein
MRMLVIGWYLLMLFISVVYILTPSSMQSEVLRIAVCAPLGGSIYYAVTEIIDWWKLK